MRTASCMVVTQASSRPVHLHLLQCCCTSGTLLTGTTGVCGWEALRSHVQRTGQVREAIRALVALLKFVATLARSRSTPAARDAADAGEALTDDHRQVAAAMLSAGRHCYDMACAEVSWTPANKVMRDGHWRRAEQYQCGHGSPWDWTTGGTDAWYASRHGLVELTRLLYSMASGQVWIPQEWAMSTAFFLMSNGDDWIIMAGYR